MLQNLSYGKEQAEAMGGLMDVFGDVLGCGGDHVHPLTLSFTRYS